MKVQQTLRSTYLFSSSICKLCQPLGFWSSQWVHFMSDEKNAKQNVKLLVKKSELISLVSSDGKAMGLKTKVEAENLAKKNNMSLSRVNDSQIKKYAVYKLLDASQLLQMQEKDTEDSTYKNSVKTISIGYKIADNDLKNKNNMIAKWIAKNQRVKVIVTGEIGKQNILESFFEKFEQSFKNDARLLNKVIAKGNLKFMIAPLAIIKTENKFEINNEDTITETKVKISETNDTENSKNSQQ